MSTASPPFPKQTDVAVVGGGAAGLTAALVLGRAGLSVCVTEKQADPTEVPRGEIIQPNGLAVLDRLGLLDRVRALPHAETRWYRFCRIGGKALARFDYNELDTPHATTLVLMPDVIRQAQMAALAELPNVSFHAGVRCTGLMRDGGHSGQRITGIITRQGHHTRRIGARLVIGADGALSRVRRELGTGQRITRYPEGYLTGFVPRPEGFDRDGYYYLGKHEILGLFPVSDDTLYFFYLIPFDRVAQLRGRSVRWLRERVGQIHPALAGAAEHIQHWRDLHFFPCLKVMAHRWFAPGAALVGHAAHSVNPHTAQGRNMAMVDAETLANAVIPELLKGHVSTRTLNGYERQRRPQAEALQRLGDELVLFWNAGNPVLTALRNQGFRTLSRRPGLRDRVTAEIAGLTAAPLGPWERIRLALGL